MSVVIDQRHHTTPQMFLSQRQGRGSSTDPGGASPPGSAAAEAPSVPGVFRTHLPCVPGGFYDHPHPRGGHHNAAPFPRSDRVRSTRQAARPASGALRAQHDPVTGQILLAGKGCRTLVCGWPRVTPTTPFSYLGGPCTDSLALLSPASTPGVPAANVAGVSREHSQNLSCTRNLKGPDAASNPSGPCRAGSGVSGVFASAATRADTRTSRRYGVSP